MASLKTLLQLPRGWHPTRQSASIHGLNVYLKASSKTARCPDCLKRSNSIHSHRERRLQHLPCVGQTLYLKVRKLKVSLPLKERVNLKLIQPVMSGLL